MVRAPRTKAASAERASTPIRFRLHHAGREIGVSEAGCIIGRASECEVQLTGGLVSRRHARVTVTADGLVVEDLGSRNGVLVNQRKIGGPTVVSHGDVIGVGLESIDVVDEHVLRHPAHLSTLPPPSPVPPGDADVDAPEQLTVSAELAVLSEREREVLELIVLGYTQREVAERLHVSVKTIETHRARISEKLSCRTRAELVTYAIQAGMLSGILRTQGRPQGEP